MNASAYLELLQKLGFADTTRGKPLAHKTDIPTLYFNRKRSGNVYFTGYRNDNSAYDSKLWQELPAQQLKDDKPNLVTLIPADGQEVAAFQSFLALSALRPPNIFGTVRSTAGIAQLTSAAAVQEAIKECDLLGREAFLTKYGYRPSRLYPLNYQGHLYDSKAIAGVAVGKEHGRPLKPSDFSGGMTTVVRILRRLGFELGDNVQPLDFLNAGTVYFRRDLVERFGGQLQSGIWTPRECDVVFVFSGESGKTYGYQDGWTAAGIFRYTGEGQVGDMIFDGGNKAIRDHRQNGKDLLLFQDLGKGKGVRYVGLFECAAIETITGPDKNQNFRSVIVFDLVAVKSSAALPEESTQEMSNLPAQSLEHLRQNAYAAARASSISTNTKNTRQTWYERSSRVRDYVLARAGGICEACDEQAPFLKRNGSPYLEPHHTHRLADEGPDHPAWVGAVCPTCHRRIHPGRDGEEWNARQKERLEAKEVKEKSGPF